MSGILNKREWASLMLMRVSKEKSRALPAHSYFDPSKSVLFESERKAKADAKAARKK